MVASLLVLLLREMSSMAEPEHLSVIEKIEGYVPDWRQRLESRPDGIVAEDFVATHFNTLFFDALEEKIEVFLGSWAFDT